MTHSGIISTVLTEQLRCEKQWDRMLRCIKRKGSELDGTGAGGRFAKPLLMSVHDSRDGTCISMVQIRSDLQNRGATLVESRSVLYSKQVEHVVLEYF